MKKYKFDDNHHIIPSSRAPEGYNTKHHSNLITINRNIHTNIHRLYKNMTPQEQLNFWLELNKSTLANNVKYAVLECITQDIEDFYIKPLTR